MYWRIVFGPTKFTLVARSLALYGLYWCDLILLNSKLELFMTHQVSLLYDNLRYSSMGLSSIRLVTVQVIHLPQEPQMRNQERKDVTWFTLLPGMTFEVNNNDVSSVATSKKRTENNTPKGRINKTNIPQAIHRRAMPMVLVYK